MVEIPVAVPPAPSARPPRSSRSRILLSATALAAVLGLSAGGLWLSIPAPRTAPESSAQASVQDERQDEAAATPAPEDGTRSETAAVAPPPFDDEAVDAVDPLRSALRDGPLPFAHLAALPDPVAPPADESPLEVAVPESPPVAESAPAVPSVRTVPLPVARPPQFRGPVAAELPRRTVQPRRARVAAAVPAAPMEDTRSFFEKFFGAPQSPPAQAQAQPPAQTPALAYAALSTPSVKPSPPIALSPSPVPPAASGGIAVYDISARTLTLPNGEKLEAHSGLGSLMDDARYVNLPSRGPTPPGTYDLTEREAPFHGVRAIRLTPVGGSAAVYNRVGLLAHHYLRGPSGESSGCVSLKYYDRFLQAYLRGELARLVVVPGRSDSLPAIVNRAFGGNG